MQCSLLYMFLFINYKDDEPEMKPEPEEILETRMRPGSADPFAVLCANILSAKRRRRG